MKLKTVFTILTSMGASFHQPEAVPHRPMTRCECAEVSFDSIARRMREEGLTLEEACQRTGCGMVCTACIPDLLARLGGAG